MNLLSWNLYVSIEKLYLIQGIIKWSLHNVASNLNEFHILIMQGDFIWFQRLNLPLNLLQVFCDLRKVALDSFKEFSTFSVILSKQLRDLLTLSIAVSIFYKDVCNFPKAFVGHVTPYTRDKWWIMAVLKMIV